MSEEEKINRFLNAVATKIGGNVAEDFENRFIAQQKEIERLTAESTEWESRFYNEAKKVNKTIKLLEEARENIDLPCYDRQHLIERAINELKGVDKND